MLGCVKPQSNSLGRTQSITGSCFLIEEESIRLLVHCGLNHELDKMIALASALQRCNGMDIFMPTWSERVVLEGLNHEQQTINRRPVLVHSG